MGISPFKRCGTSLDNPAAVAPNPSPSRWELLDLLRFKRSYVMKVRYLDATNFEGVKILVYQGKYIPKSVRDPHFDERDESLVARFRPTEDGWTLAVALAKQLSLRQ